MPSIQKLDEHSPLPRATVNANFTDALRLGDIVTTIVVMLIPGLTQRSCEDVTGNNAAQVQNSHSGYDGNPS